GTAVASPPPRVLLVCSGKGFPCPSGTAAAGFNSGQAGGRTHPGPESISSLGNAGRQATS
ncbi:MAG TPA: hypothetical protein VEQ67_13055, partial [Mycobacterium sp.]|nr:hypothetical protein [Mycobacterium sp.]